MWCSRRHFSSTSFSPKRACQLCPTGKSEEKRMWVPIWQQEVQLFGGVCLQDNPFSVNLWGWQSSPLGLIGTTVGRVHDLISGWWLAWTCELLVFGIGWDWQSSPNNYFEAEVRCFNFYNHPLSTMDARQIYPAPKESRIRLFESWIKLSNHKLTSKSGGRIGAV